MGKINYGKAVYSVAMIDLDTFLEYVLSIDEELKDANFVLGYVLSKNDYVETEYLFKEHAFNKFAKVKCALDKIEKEILKYQSKLNAFFECNEEEKNKFYEKLDILIPLHEEKSKFVKEQLHKCFEIIKSNQYCENIESTLNA